MELFGKYKLGDRIGRGGMAEVYQAQVLGAAGFARQIAVKRILPELVEDIEFREMFADEAKLAAQLDHPNIVQIFDFDQVGDSFYIAMEHVNGADLSKLMAAAGRQRELLEPEVVVFVIEEVLAGLRYAHDLTDGGRPLGLVHRDISPANILLSYSGAVKLADFGIAKAATSMVRTQGGVLKGKVPYMSPEQAAGEPLDRRSDLFSVGIILYQALVGKRPFSGSNPGMVLNKLCRGEYIPPRSLVSSLPPKLEHVISRALCVDPDERYQTAGEFLADLRASIDTLPTRENLERCLARLIPMHPSWSDTRPREVSTMTDEARRKTRQRGRLRRVEEPSPDARDKVAAALSDPTRDRPATEKPSGEGWTPTSGGADGPVSPRPDEPSTNERLEDRDEGEAFVEAATERLESLSEIMLEEAKTTRISPSPSAVSRSKEADEDGARQSRSRLVEETTSTVRGEHAPPRSRWLRRLAGAGVFGGLIVTAVVFGVVIALDREGSHQASMPQSTEEETSFTVLGRRSPDQWTELRRHGLDEALESRGLELRQLEYNAYPKLLELLRDTQVDLVNAPLSLARALTEQELIVPIDRAAREEFKAIRARLTVPALKVGVVDTTLGTRMAFIPEYVEAHVMIYRVSKVALARRRFPELRPAIEAALAAVNGRGLPAGYELEEDPASWDEFDLFVVGYVWANIEEGNPQPRLAIRSRGYWPSVDALVERAALHGQTQTTLVQGQALLDVLMWLALHREHDLDRPEVWARRAADRPSGTTLTHWIAWDSIYLARVNQFRCAELREHLRDHQMSFGVDDLAFAPLPSGVSVQLDDDGRPLRVGNNVGLVNAWLWAIPRSARDKRRSLDVILDLVDVPHQTYFANRNCWIPINSAIDTSEGSAIDAYCRRAMHPGAETLERAWFVYNPPNLEALDEALESYNSLWSEVFAKRGYRPTGGDDGPISLERIEELMKQHVPPG